MIDAFHNDVRFDEFLRLQLAGDELRSGEPDAAVATGFLLCGPDMPDINLQEERRHQVLNEMASTVGAVFLGMQFGCAQCHDHKFDPITIHDFYRLRAFFESADVFREHPIPTPAEAAAYQAAEAEWTREDRMGAKRRRELEELGRKRFREKNPDQRPALEQVLGELKTAEREEHGRLAARIDLLPELPELPRGRVFRNGEHRSGHVYLRGDFRRQGPEVSCGFPRALEPDPAADGPTTRTALADWLTQPDHPLTSRVIVNRLWQWHFGVGLSDSPSDFGIMGSEPMHPELLDWLTREFVRGGWSMKRMHRLLMISETYKLATVPFDPEWSVSEVAVAQQTWKESTAQDAENSLLWHRARSRLDGEAIRDAMLSASDRLSPRQGGPGVRPPLPREVTNTLLKDQWPVTANAEDHRRRSIYLFVRRNLRYPLFDVFDRPDTNASCPMRHESTTATQSLVLLNSAFSLECARQLAHVLAAADPHDESRRINRAYRSVFGRSASAEEARLAEAFLDRQEKLLRSENRAPASLALPGGSADEDNRFRRAAFVDLCLALFNASEFVYVD